MSNIRLFNLISVDEDEGTGEILGGTIDLINLREVSTGARMENIQSPSLESNIVRSVTNAIAIPPIETELKQLEEHHQFQSISMLARIRGTSFEEAFLLDQKINFLSGNKKDCDIIDDDDEEDFDPFRDVFTPLDVFINNHEYCEPFEHEEIFNLEY